MKYPTDSGLADAGVRALAREGRKLAAKVGEKRNAVRDRSQVGGPQAQGADTLDPPPLRGSEGRGAEVDRRDGARCSSSRSRKRGNWPRDRPLSCARARRACEAQGRPGAGGARRSPREGDRANPQAGECHRTCVRRDRTGASCLQHRRRRSSASEGSPPPSRIRQSRSGLSDVQVEEAIGQARLSRAIGETRSLVHPVNPELLHKPIDLPRRDPVDIRLQHPPR